MHSEFEKMQISVFGKVVQKDESKTQLSESMLGRFFKDDNYYTYDHLLPKGVGDDFNNQQYKEMLNAAKKDLQILKSEGKNGKIGKDSMGLPYLEITQLSESMLGRFFKDDNYYTYDHLLPKGVGDDFNNQQYKEMLNAAKKDLQILKSEGKNGKIGKDSMGLPYLEITQLSESTLRERIKSLIHNSLDEAKKKKDELEPEPTQDEPEEEVTVKDTIEPQEPTNSADINPQVKSIQDNLQKAYASAKALGDAKLVTQLGNTITMLTRDQILGGNEQVNENEEYESADYTRGFDAGYQQGYKDAQSEAYKEIQKNYSPNLEETKLNENIDGFDPYEVLEYLNLDDHTGEEQLEMLRDCITVFEEKIDEVGTDESPTLESLLEELEEDKNFNYNPIQKRVEDLIYPLTDESVENEQVEEAAKEIINLVRIDSIGKK